MSAPRGEKNKCSKLTELDVIAMRCMGSIGFSPYLLGKIFGVSRVQARRVLRGTKWGWL